MSEHTVRPYWLLSLVPALFPLRPSSASSSTVCVTIRLDAISQTTVPLAGAVQRRLDQAWFWTPEWQAKEREADRDLATGHYEVFETIDDFIQGLEDEVES
ncbi:MAG: hypothetical protein FJY85_13730 [Deltaproteobacteria bacterium]|nr:hypothetical protein [Deltaproteobacteria bacterium]